MTQLVTRVLCALITENCTPTVGWSQFGEVLWRAAARGRPQSTREAAKEPPPAQPLTRPAQSLTRPARKWRWSPSSCATSDAGVETGPWRCARWLGSSSANAASSAKGPAPRDRWQPCQTPTQSWGAWPLQPGRLEAPTAIPSSAWTPTPDPQPSRRRPLHSLSFIS